MHKQGFAPSPDCECGAPEQTADHVLTTYCLHLASPGAILNLQTLYWLNIIAAASDPGSTGDRGPTESLVGLYFATYYAINCAIPVVEPRYRLLSIAFNLINNSKQSSIR